MSTASTWCSRACPTICPMTARCSSSRLRPLRVLPTCQSEVCRNFMSSVLGSDAAGLRRAVGRRRSGSRVNAEAVGRVAGAGGGVPHSDCRVAQAGNGNSTASGTGISGWDDEHGARLGQGGPGALAGRQEPVLGAAGLGGVQPADHPDAGVGHDPAFHLARRLLGADQDDAQAPAAFGDVQQHVLDRAVALARRVLVELVDHREQQAARPGGLLAGGLRGEHHADHEPLRAFPQVVQVDHGDLLIAGGDLTGVPVSGRSARIRLRSGVSEESQPANEGVDGAGPGDRSGPFGAGVVVGEPVDDHVDQVLVGAAGGHRRC